MQARAARLIRYRVPFRRPYVTAAGTSLFREGFLVEIETSDGVRGLGEASLLPGRERANDELSAELEASLRRSMGAFMLDLTTASAEGTSAAIEIAAWDAIARSEGRCLAAKLGDVSATGVPLNALITASAPDDVYAETRAAREAGFATVKLKVGVCQNFTQESERVAAARRALGPGLGLRLDANGAWSESEAVDLLRVFEPYAVEYVEQPVAPGHLYALRRLRQSTPIAVAVDEDIVGIESVLAIIEIGAADVLVLKPLQLGGIGPCIGTIRAARAAGLEVTITTSIDSGVGTAAALQIAASMPGLSAAGLATLQLLESSLIREELRIERGRMLLPAGHGLGVSLDEAALEHYAVSVKSFVL